ncbi:MAG: cation transporter [Planctomycetales bacterium]|nr:cation transporter [Planctomycetales bacterium]
MVATRLVLILASLATGVAGGAAELAEPAPPRPAAGQVRIVAEKMCCKGCAQRVSGQLYTVKGVKSVEVDLASRVLTVSVPQETPKALGAIWHAVQQGDGGPATLATHTTTYRLVSLEEGQKQGAHAGSLRIVIDNLHCTGCAQKIASRLYTIKGVTKVQVDMQANTLLVTARPGSLSSPWPAVAAVADAKERAVSVSGEFGVLAIEYSEAAAVKTHQAQHANPGGARR